MNKRFKYLLSRYAEGTISIAEHDEFFELVASGKYNEFLEEHFDATVQSINEQFSEKIPESISHEIIRNIIGQDKQRVLPLQKNRKVLTLWKWVAAASVLMICAATVYFFNTSKKDNMFALSFMINSSEKQVNTTTNPMAVWLPDGSRIVLKPKSSVYYSRSAFQKNREVYMEGEAYFKIAKNPLKPFCVYYGKVITKVLGTSFTIKTNQVTGNVEVEVLTGKVQVYENAKVTGHQADKSLSLIITPNQKAIYEKDKSFFETALVDNPKPITVFDDEEDIKEVAVKPTNFNFESAKLGNILNKISDSYGVDIVANNDEIYNCIFSGDVNKENLYDKLKIICLATGNTYEISGTKILIKGTGCKPARK